MGGALAVVLAFGGVAAAQAPAAPAKPLAAKGEAVTITGCVLAGSKESSVLLTHVSEGAAGSAPQEAWLGAEGMVEPDAKQQVVY